MPTPTAEQTAIVGLALNSEANILVNALAGTGKTSTIEMVCNAVTNIPILYLAFNKRIVSEAEKRMPSHVECRTQNSLGHRVWAQATGRRLVVDSSKMRHILKNIISDLPRKDQGEAWEDLSDTLRWISRAKRDGYVPHDWQERCHPIISDWQDFVEAQDDIEPTHQQRGLIERALHFSILAAHEGGIDFDDQIYMPCQPAGTMIETKAGKVAIQDIKEGDEVISFDRRLSRFVGMYNHGSRVAAIAQRDYKGPLYEIYIRDRKTVATKEHKWLVRFIPGLSRKSLWLTYLMFRDGSFKLGQCQIRSVRPDSSDGFGLAVRCNIEGAQQAWILAVHNSLQEAKFSEALNVMRFGITDCAFRSDIGERVHRAQREFSDMWDRAEACLKYYGREYRFPFWESNATRAFNSNFITQSCNLIEDIMEIPVYEKDDPAPNWQKFGVGSYHSQETVYSLKIERHELYVADGILTHNCIFGGPWPKFPLVIVDEVQDQSPLNHEMMKKLVTKRFMGVGDPCQSIYAFRGAVTNGMRALSKHFNCVELPLTLTFRVPKRGVIRARERAPDYMFHPDNPDGLILELNEWGPDDVPASAAIICRNNAPLLSLGFKLLAARRSIKLVGMDIGAGLVRILRKLGPPDLKGEELERAITRWMETALAKARNPATVYDRADCIHILTRGWSNLGEAIIQAEALFKQEGPIHLLSIHKSKGLEYDWVMHLDAWRVPSKFAKEGTEAWEQELNCRYVAETRFKQTLVLANLEGWNHE